MCTATVASTLFVCVHFMNNSLKTTDEEVISTLLYQLTIAVSMVNEKCSNLSNIQDQQGMTQYVLTVVQLVSLLQKVYPQLWLCTITFVSCYPEGPN